MDIIDIIDINIIIIKYIINPLFIPFVFIYFINHIIYLPKKYIMLFG